MGTEQLHSAVAAIKSRLGLERLSMRERMILFAGALFIAGILVYQLIISPYVEARARLLNTIERKKEELVEIRQLRQQYADLRAAEGDVKASLAKRGKGFTLFAFLDQQADKAGIKPQIKYMKPSVITGEGNLDESVVEMKLEGVTLERLTEFLRLTESEAESVSVKRLSIQTSSRDEGVLDVILQIVTFMEAG